MILNRQFATLVFNTSSNAFINQALNSRIEVTCKESRIESIFYNKQLHVLSKTSQYSTAWEAHYYYALRDNAWQHMLILATETCFARGFYLYICIADISQLGD